MSLGTIEWSCYFYWHGWSGSSTCCSYCPCGQVICLLIQYLIFLFLVWEVKSLLYITLLLSRFFTGHTKDPDGTVQFTAGKTKVGDAIDGFVKIFTVAVCIHFNNV